MIIRSPEELGLYVRNQRKAQKQVQSEVADLVGLKQATVSDFENNPATSKIETLFRILAATNLEMHLTLRGEKFVEEYSMRDDQW